MSTWRNPVFLNHLTDAKNEEQKILKLKQRTFSPLELNFNYYLGVRNEYRASKEWLCAKFFCA